MSANILLVDDEDSVRITLQAVLQQEGYTLTAVSTGVAALQAIREQRFDLLLTDLRIDEIDGLTLLAAAQKRDPETISILLTGYASLESAVQALRHGAFNYLLKPCNLEEMKLTIVRGLEKKRLAEALRERVIELEQANETIRSFSAQLEDKVKQATAELADRVVELQQARGRMDTVIDAMQDGLLVYDSQGVLRANQFMLALFGLNFKRIQGKSQFDLAKLTGEPPIVDGSNDRGSPAPVTFELAGPRKRYVRRMATIVAGGEANDHGLVVIYQDVTDQKEVEQLKDDFLSIASHELKTPLTSILGYTQLLGRRLSKVAPVNVGDILDVVESQCRRMKRLVDDLLDVSRIERGMLQTSCAALDLSGMVDRLLSQVRATESKHRFHASLPREGVLVWADEDRLQQVIANLIDNAVKYSPDGGPIDISVLRRDDAVEVTVADQGIGIPPEQHDRIFTRFYQAESVVRSRRFGGMGLGLFISKAIVDEMGGSMSLESTVGAGSTFKFSLPLYKN